MLMMTKSATFVNLDKRKVRSSVVPNLVLTILLATVAITPYLSRNASYILNLIIWFFWCISSLTLPGKQVYKIENKVFKWWVIYMVWILTMCIIGHSNVSINFILIRLPIYTVPIMMSVVLTKYNRNEKRVLWRTILLVFSCNLAHNILLGIFNPDAFISLDGINPTKEDNATNAGGTAFVVICLFVSAILWVFIRTSVKKTLFYSLLLLASLIYILFINSRTTILLTLVVLVVGFVIATRPNLNKWRLILGLAVFTLLAFFFFVPLLQWLIDVFADSQRMTERLSDLLTVSEGTNPEDLENGSLAQRYLLWTTSINTFLSDARNFLIGVGEDNHGYDFFSLIKSGVGAHSEFFDLAAKYGLIGIVIVYKALCSTFVKILSTTDDLQVKNMSVAIMIAFLLYSFVNTTFVAGIFYIMFIFFPLSLMLSDKK